MPLQSSDSLVRPFKSCARAAGFGVIFLGLAALEVETRGKRRPAEWLAVSVGLISTLALVGYLYGVRSFYGISGSLKLSWQTAVGFMVLSIGLLMARPEAGLMTVLSSSSLGGR